MTVVSMIVALEEYQGRRERYVMTRDERTGQLRYTHSPAGGPLRVERLIGIRHELRMLLYAVISVRRVCRIGHVVALKCSQDT
mgnify:CR=1 FL=1